MNTQSLLLAAVFFPIIGSCVVPLAGWISPRLRNGFALACVLSSLCSAVCLLPSVFAGDITSVSYSLPLGFNFILTADCLSVFMAITASLIGSIIVFYSWGYINHYKNQHEYYFLVTLFLGSMMGIVFSGNLIFLYVFWEVTALASWRLIGFFREKSYVIRADKAFMITMFGAVMMLMGFITLFQQTGSFDLANIKNALGTTPAANLAVLLILMGILSKSATLPFHTWLPDAGVAPAPVTALLHAAVLVKIGVYVYARLFIATMPIALPWHTIIPVVAGASALISAGAALIETDLKRIIAYSTISQIGFIFLGLSTGSEIGIAGGLMYILMHGIAKGGLFLCAGIVEQNMHEKNITKLGGLFRTMPITAIAFLLCSLSVMGIPPLGGFFSKHMVISGAIAGGHPVIAFVFLVGAFLTILYLLRVFTMVFLGDPQTPTAEEGSPTMVISVSVLAMLSVAGGLYINYISTPIEYIVKQMVR
ncbi:MAG: NADH-quinone oxidoreductase subunit L [Elusimicrobia bacterium]|nr:NADH-quinone oxidoreductase subunit L [Elusimicrobiota bacterium]